MWVWLSFADQTGSLGVAIVEVDGTPETNSTWIIKAVGVAHQHGINPGGEVIGMPISTPLEKYRYRLLSPAEALEIGDRATNDQLEQVRNKGCVCCNARERHTFN